MLDLSSAFEEVSRHPIIPKVVVVDKKIWDSLPEGEAEFTEFDGFKHLAIKHDGVLLLHPISEIISITP
jgi:hypothetical protein